MDTLLDVLPNYWMDDFMPSHKARHRYRRHHGSLPIVTDIPVPIVETPCAANPDLFSDNMKNAAAAAESRSLCIGCHNFAACREYGLAHPEETGTYGGLTQRERKHRARKAAA